MEAAPADLDVQAFCRSLALQQIQMLTRLAEIAMQLAEGEGTRAVEAQARTAQPKADEAAVQTARAEAQEAGLAFSRFSRTVQRSVALRARAADTLSAREKTQAAEIATQPVEAESAMCSTASACCRVGERALLAGDSCSGKRIARGRPAAPARSARNPHPP
jgi:hypothetical protein